MNDEDQSAPLNEEVPEYVRPIYNELSQTKQQLQEVINRLESKESLSAQEQKRLTDAKAQQEVKQAVDEEETQLISQYPVFAQWIDYYKKTGLHTPEFEEVLNIVENEGVSLKRATQLFFFEKGMPQIQQDTKKRVVDNMKAKAKNTTEGSATSGSLSVDTLPRRAGINDISEQLIQAAMKNGALK